MSACKITTYLTGYAKNLGVNNFSIEHSIDGRAIALFNDKRLFAHLVISPEVNQPASLPYADHVHCIDCLQNSTPKSEKHEIKNLTTQEKLALMIAIINAIRETCSNIDRCYEQDLKSAFDAVMAIMVRKN